MVLNRSPPRNLEARVVWQDLAQTCPRETASMYTYVTHIALGNINDRPKSLTDHSCSVVERPQYHCIPLLPLLRDTLNTGLN